MAENYEKLLTETVLTSFLMQIYKHYANKTKKVEKSIEIMKNIFMKFCYYEIMEFCNIEIMKFCYSGILLFCNTV